MPPAMNRGTPSLTKFIHAPVVHSYFIPPVLLSVPCPSVEVPLCIFHPVCVAALMSWCPATRSPETAVDRQPVEPSTLPPGTHNSTLPSDTHTTFPPDTHNSTLPPDTHTIQKPAGHIGKNLLVTLGKTYWSHSGKYWSHWENLLVILRKPDHTGETY